MTAAELREWQLAEKVAEAAERYRVIRSEHPQIAGEAWRKLCKALDEWKWGEA